MQVLINQQSFDLPEGATVADATSAFGAVPPFAVAVNLHFVHREAYQSTRLAAGDQVEIVQPVAGG